MISLPVQITVASNAVTYMKMLFEAGAIAVDPNTHVVTVETKVNDMVRLLHRDLSHGDTELEDALNEGFDKAIAETNDLITGKGLVAYP